MSAIRVHELRWLDEHFDGIAGINIDVPVSDTRLDICALPIVGWVIADGGEKLSVEVSSRGAVLRRTPVRLERRDVASRYGETAEGSRVGFSTRVGGLDLDRHFALTLSIVFPNERTVDVAEIEGERDPVPTEVDEHFSPLMVTSWGRSGTTWLMALLMQDPRILVYPGYPYEVRTASYWWHAARVLSGASDHLGSSHPDTFLENLRFLGHDPWYFEDAPLGDSMTDWRGGQPLSRIATFAKQMVDDFYCELGRKVGKSGACYFAEKCIPTHIPDLLFGFYPRAREIFLVRDFRDVMASVFAFNERRGVEGFGRSAYPDDASFVSAYAQGPLATLTESWTRRSGTSLLLRYEDLIGQPEVALTKVMDYLALPIDPGTAQRMASAASGVEELAGHRTSQDAGGVGRWKVDLDDHVRDMCDEEFAEALDVFGYR